MVINTFLEPLGYCSCRFAFCVIFLFCLYVVTSEFILDCHFYIIIVIIRLSTVVMSLIVNTVGLLLY